jgi:hypothetical protein
MKKIYFITALTMSIAASATQLHSPAPDGVISGEHDLASGSSIVIHDLETAGAESPNLAATKINMDRQTDEPLLLEVATSRYDFQHNGSMSKMIAVSADGVAHIAFMGGTNTSDLRRVLAVCVTPDTTIYGPLDTVNYRTGYVTVAVTSENPDNGMAANSTVCAWHGAPVSDLVSVFAVDFGGCWMAFNTLNGTRDECIWPHVALDYQDRGHVVSSDSSTGADEDKVYYNSTDNGMEWNGEFVTVTTNSNVVSAIPVAAKSSPGAAVVFMEDAACVGEAQSEATIWHHDVLYYETRDPDNDLFLPIAEGNPVNVSNFNCPDSGFPFKYGVFAFADLEGIYDKAEEPVLHLAFTTPVLLPDSICMLENDLDSDSTFFYYDDDPKLWASNFSAIWHYDTSTEEFSRIAGWLSSSAEDDRMPNPGVFRTSIDRPSLALDQENGYLYCIWNQYSIDDIRDSWSDGMEMPNGEIYAACSADNGSTWGPRVNLTNTESNGCDVGECLSETFATVSEFVFDGHLHISYMLDLHAGAVTYIPGGNPIGEYTDNPIIYMQVPVEDVPPHDGEAWDADGHVGMWFYNRFEYWPEFGGHPDSIAVVDKPYLFNEYQEEIVLAEMNVIYHSDEVNFNLWAENANEEAGAHNVGFAIKPGHPSENNGYIDMPSGIPANENYWNGTLAASSVTQCRVWVENFGLPMADQLFEFRFEDLLGNPIAERYWRYQYIMDGEAGEVVPMGVVLQVDSIDTYQRLNVYTSEGVGIDVEITEPVEFTLMQNFPNPFNPTTSISFTINTAAQTSLIVYNILGEEVAKLYNGVATPGDHSVTFDASQQSSGVYFYTLTSNGVNETRKMLLAK